MKTARRPHMLAAPLLEMREFLPEYPARPSFQALCNETERILRRVFKENVDMVGINSYLDYFNAQFLTGFTDDTVKKKVNAPPFTSNRIGQ